MQDPESGLFIPQPAMPLSDARLPKPKPRGWGHVTYRCHTCGESIVKPYEVLFVDEHHYASPILPGKVSRTTTTHHDWHMQSQQYED